MTPICWTVLTMVLNTIVFVAAYYWGRDSANERSVNDGD